MTPFSISGLLIAFSSFGLGLFVLLRSSDKKIGRLWFLFSVAAGMWGTGITWIGSNKAPHLGLFIWQLTYALGVIWISPLFFHFTCTFLGNEKKRFVFVHYLIGGLFVFLLPTKAFFAKAELVFNQFCYIRGGGFYYLFITWWIGLVILSHLNLIKAFHSATTTKKNQIKYFFLATAIGYSGGFHTYFPKMGIDIYPWGSFAVVLYPVIMTYAILKYNLMDITIFIRRAVVFTAVYFLLVLGVTPLIIHLHKTMINTPERPLGLLTLEVLLIGGVLSLGPFIYAYLVRRSFWLRGHTSKGLAHELKSPLSSIQSALDITLEHVKGLQGDKTKVFEYLEMIQNNANRMDQFIINLLSVAKSEQGPATLQKTKFDFIPILKRTLQSAQPLLDQKNIQITITAPAYFIIEADEPKIEQIFSNLISNAVKFSSQGTITVRLEKTKNDWLCSVEDEGVGIDSRHLPKIFDKFFQAHPGSKGTGIGLTIAKAWVEAHGGKIWAESEGDGKGTTMKFTLPI